VGDGAKARDDVIGHYRSGSGKDDSGHAHGAVVYSRNRPLLSLPWAGGWQKVR